MAHVIHHAYGNSSTCAPISHCSLQWTTLIYGCMDHPPRNPCWYMSMYMHVCLRACCDACIFVWSVLSEYIARCTVIWQNRKQQRHFPRACFHYLTSNHALDIVKLCWSLRSLRSTNRTIYCSTCLRHVNIRIPQVLLDMSPWLGPLEHHGDDPNERTRSPPPKVRSRQENQEKTSI